VITEVDCNLGLDVDLTDIEDSSLTLDCPSGTVTRFFDDVQACAPVLVADPELFCRQACDERGRDQLGRRRRGKFISGDLRPGGRAIHVGAGQCTDGDGGQYVWPAITDEDVRRGRVQREFSSMDVSIDHPDIRGTAEDLYIEDTEISIRGARCSDPLNLERRCDLFIESFSVRAGWEDAFDGPYASVPFRIDGARISDFGFRLSSEVQGRMEQDTPEDTWSAVPVLGSTPNAMNLELGGRIRKDVPLGTVNINLGQNGDDPGDTLWMEPGGQIETDLTSPLQFMTLVGAFSDTRRRGGEDVAVGIEIDALFKFFSGSPVANFEFIRAARPPAFMMSMRGSPPGNEPMGIPPSPEQPDGEGTPGQFDPDADAPQSDVPAWEGATPFAPLPDSPSMGAGRMTSIAAAPDPWMVLDGSGSDPFPGMPIDEYRWYYRHHGVTPELVLLFGLGPRVQIRERAFDAIRADPEQTICLLVVGEDGLRSEKCLDGGATPVEVPIEPRVICNELATTVARASLFRRAVMEASAIPAPGNGHTWFVPTDDAIEADIGVDRFERLFAPENQSELEHFVRSHVYENEVRRADIAVSLAGAPSEAGDAGRLTSSEKQDAVYDGDVPCGGGILHGVEHALYVPAL